jgi:hypothetical protein
MQLHVLKHLAIEAAAFRGHEIEWEPLYKMLSRKIQNGKCRKCGMECQINTNPLPNEISIGGEAIALNCEPPAA